MMFAWQTLNLRRIVDEHGHLAVGLQSGVWRLTPDESRITRHLRHNPTEARRMLGGHAFLIYVQVKDLAGRSPVPVLQICPQLQDRVPRVEWEALSGSKGTSDQIGISTQDGLD